MVESHDNKYKESNEEIIERLEEMKQNQVIVSQAVFAQLDEIRKLRVKDDQQVEADLGSFMSSNQIETVDLEQVSKDENKPSHIHKLRQMPKDEWSGDFTAKIISMQEESTLPLNNKKVKAFCKGWLEDHVSNIQFIVWPNSTYNDYTGLPVLVAGNTYSFSGGYTSEYDNQTSLVFNKATTIREVNHE